MKSVESIATQASERASSEQRCRSIVKPQQTGTSKSNLLWLCVYDDNDQLKLCNSRATSAERTNSELREELNALRASKDQVTPLSDFIIFMIWV